MNDRVAWGLLLSGGLPEVAPLPRSKTRIQTKITIIIVSTITITINTTIITFIKAPSSTITLSIALSIFCDQNPNPLLTSYKRRHVCTNTSTSNHAMDPRPWTIKKLRYSLTEGRVDQIWVMWSFVISRALKICEGSTAVSCWVPKNGFDGSRQIGLTHSTQLSLRSRMIEGKYRPTS